MTNNTTSGRSGSSSSSTVPILNLTQFGARPGTTTSGSTVIIGWVLAPFTSNWCSLVPKLIVDNTTSPITTNVLTTWPEVFEGVGVSQVSVALPYTKIKVTPTQDVNFGFESPQTGTNPCTQYGRSVSQLVVHIELWCTTLSSPNTSVCCGQSPSFSLMPVLSTPTTSMPTMSSSFSSFKSYPNTITPTSLIWPTPMPTSPTTSSTLSADLNDFPIGWVVFCAIVVFFLAFVLFWHSYRQRKDQDRKQKLKRSISRPSLISSSTPWRLGRERRSARQTQRRDDLEMAGGGLLTMTPSGRRVLPYRFTRRSLDEGDPGISPPLMTDHDPVSQRGQPWSLLLPQKPPPVATVSRCKRTGTTGAGRTLALVRAVGHHQGRTETFQHGQFLNTPIDHAQHLYQQQQEQRHLPEERQRQKVERRQQCLQQGQQKKEEDQQRILEHRQLQRCAPRAQNQQDIFVRQDSLAAVHPPPRMSSTLTVDHFRNLTGHQDQTQISIQVSGNVKTRGNNNDSSASQDYAASMPPSARARARARELVHMKPDTIDLEIYYSGLDGDDGDGQRNDSVSMGDTLSSSPYLLF